MAEITRRNPDGLYAPESYWNAVEVKAGSDLVFSSGIVGMTADGTIPDEPKAQVDLAWDNLAAFLKDAGLTSENLVRLQMYYASRAVIDLSREARIRVLGDHMGCAVTGIVCGLMDEEFVLEIDLVAAR